MCSSNQTNLDPFDNERGFIEMETLATFVEVQPSFILFCVSLFIFLCSRLLWVFYGSNFLMLRLVSKMCSAAFDHLKGMQRKVMETKLSLFSSSCKVRVSAWPDSFVADIQECLHSSSSSQALGHPPFFISHGAAVNQILRPREALERTASVNTSSWEPVGSTHSTDQQVSVSMFVFSSWFSLGFTPKPSLLCHVPNKQI